jgi:cell division protein FtsI (penicillin-binding protein 3)
MPKLPVRLVSSAVVALAVLASLVCLWYLRRPIDRDQHWVGDRGRILDRAGRTLAEDAVGDVIWIDEEHSRDLAVTVERACAALDGCTPETRAALLAERTRGRRWRVVRGVASSTETARIRELAIPGVYLGRRPLRAYPHGDVGVVVIGHVGADHHGQSGIEYAHETMLRARGRVDGSDVRLTLDIEVQRRLERRLEQLAGDTNATTASAVLLEPATGDVRAALQWPSPQRTAFSLTAPEWASPRFVTEVVEMGPLVAPLLVAGDRRGVPLDDAEARTLNRTPKVAGTVLLRRRGLEWGARTLAGLGIGARPGSGLQGETRGWTGATWEADAGRAGERFGRGELTAASLLQVASAYGALLNDGERVPPRLVMTPHGQGGSEDLDTIDRGRVRSTAGIDPVLGTWSAERDASEVPGLVFLQTAVLRRFDARGVTSVIALGGVERDGQVLLLALQLDAPAPVPALRRAARRGALAMLEQ